MKYSVLMSVYQKENPDYLKKAVESILNQTVKPDDFLIVWDGPLTLQLAEVLERFRAEHTEMIHFLKLERNVGLGEALRQGVEACRNSLIARMDSDDISVPERMEWQLEAFQRIPSLALCGGQIEEFQVIPEEIQSIRMVPISHDEIVSCARKRNPMNHMTVMFRKEYVLSAGNYQPMAYMEDYYLWVRMLMKGAIAVNLPQILVKARVGNGMLARRGGFQYAVSIKNVMLAFYKIGFISRYECISNIVIRGLVSLMPSRIRQMIYHKALRQRRG